MSAFAARPLYGHGTQNSGTWSSMCPKKCPKRLSEVGPERPKKHPRLWKSRETKNDNQYH
eukprot:5950843-Amphidinium_carterae.1